MTNAKNFNDYFMIQTAMNIGTTRPGESLPHVSVYLVKMSKGKCEDIIDINSWRAESYLELAKPSYTAEMVLVNLSDHSEYINQNEVINYAKKSKILKNKLKGRDMDYILRAADHLATAPKEAAIGYEKKFYCTNSRFVLSFDAQ